MNATSALLSDDDSEKTTSLFQFWDKDIPDAVAELVRGVAEANSTLDYRLFDDESAVDFIREAFGADTVRMYQSCVIPAMRADLFRYCFLVKRGGVYVDADYTAVTSIEPLVLADWKGCLYSREKGLCNGIMYFKYPENPLAEKILEIALYNISNRTSNNVWQVTGPSVLQSIHADESSKDLFDGIHIMEDDEFALYFKPAIYLEYKSDDSHWLVARQKGLNIFRD